MKFRSLIVKSALLALLLASLATSASLACSWSSFKSASFSDISVTPQLTSGILNYQLSLGKNPTITLGGNTYKVSWIQAFYVVGSTSTTKFTAKNASCKNNWSWTSLTSKGQVSGWQGTGCNRIYAGQNKTFYFSNFSTCGNVIPGFHIGYLKGNCVVTDWFKWDKNSPCPPPTPVPEPGSLISLGLLLTSTGFAIRRKKS